MTAPRNSVPRWAWAEIDVGAVAHNVETLLGLVAPAQLWVVVKADAYGHGAVTVARAALAAGATGLCVALTSEGVALRDAGIDAPVLVLSEQPPEHAAVLVAHDLVPTVYSAAGIDALAALRYEGLPVHLKLDTGMHRVGADPDDVSALVERIVGCAPWLRLDGVFTHLAVADEPEDAFTAAQLERFDAALATVERSVARSQVHAANSAGAIAHPAARRSIVRAGIAVYGISPGPQLDDRCAELRSVLSLKARVSFVKRVAAGERVSYGLLHRFAAPATVATVPIGYADGVRRSLFPGQDVLIGGRRRPIVGVVTMDQLMVDCGDDDVAVGDEVVLIGAQGGERIRAEEWAVRLGTIGYEIVCGIGARVPRVVVGEPS